MGLFHHRQIEKSNCGGDQSVGLSGPGSCSPEDPRQQLADMRSRRVNGFADRSNPFTNGSVIIPSDNSWSNDSYTATIAKNFQYTDQNYNQALATAAREGKPIVAVFGSRSLRDSQHLVESAIPASARQKDAVYVYIDTDRAQSNPNFSNLINSEIRPTNLAHTQVYALSRDSAGKLTADRPLMTAWGGREEIANLVRDHVTFGVNNMRGRNLASGAIEDEVPEQKRPPYSPPVPDLPPLALTDTPPPPPVPAERPRNEADNLFPERRSLIPKPTEVIPQPPVRDLPPLELPIIPAPGKRIPDVTPPLPEQQNRLELQPDLFPNHRSYLPRPFERAVPPPPVPMPFVPGPSDRAVPPPPVPMPFVPGPSDRAVPPPPETMPFISEPNDRAIPAPPLPGPATRELQRPLQHRQRRATPQQTESQTETDRAQPRERQRTSEDGRVIELNPRDFERLVRNSDKPVILDVSATWCGPCRNLAPILDGVAKQYSGQATVYKLDLDRLGRENPRLAQELNASSIPAVFLYDRGKLVGRPIIGLGSPASYHQQVQSLIDRHAQSSSSGTEREVPIPRNLPLKTLPEQAQIQRENDSINDTRDDTSRPVTRTERRIERLKHKLEKLTHLSREEKEQAFKPSAREQQLLQLINAERRKERLPEFVHDPRLQIIANRHSNYQRTNNIMTHDENIRGWQNVGQRLGQVGLQAQGWCENAGPDTSSPETLVKLWMDSPKHKAAILSRGNIAAISVRGGRATFNQASDPELERT